MTDAVLSMWTVYDHPDDYPEVFVARRWEVARGQAVPTQDVLMDATLWGLRLKLPPGLMPLHRAAEDDPKIIETWI